MKKIIVSLLVVSVLGLSACNNDTESPADPIIEEDTILVLDSAEQTAERVANKYDYEMVEPESTTTEVENIEIWSFDYKATVVGTSDDELLYVGFGGLTGTEAQELLEDEGFSVAEELQEMFDATTIEERLENNVSSEYETNYDDIHLYISTEITKDDEIFFILILTNESYTLD